MPIDPNNPYADTPHPLTIGRALYGCHNHEPRRTATQAQDGWSPWGARRMVEIPVSFNTLYTCGHDLRANDAKCKDCKWL